MGKLLRQLIQHEKVKPGTRIKSIPLKNNLELTITYEESPPTNGCIGKFMEIDTVINAWLPYIIPNIHEFEEMVSKACDESVFTKLSIFFCYIKCKKKRSCYLSSVEHTKIGRILNKEEMEMMFNERRFG